MFFFSFCLICIKIENKEDFHFVETWKKHETKRLLNNTKYYYIMINTCRQRIFKVKGIRASRWKNYNGII